MSEKENKFVMARLIFFVTFKIKISTKLYDQEK